MSLEADVIVAHLLRNRLRLVASASLIVRNAHDADDVFQQVVVSALESAAEFSDTQHLTAWATRAVRHRAIDVARRKAIRPLADVVLDLIESEWGNPAEPVRTDRTEALWACFEKLTSTARDVLRLRYFDGLTVPDIATRLGRTPDAVYQLLSRTHRALRTCVQVECGQLGDVSPPRSFPSQRKEQP